ncbi:MAG: hypothetical protein LBC63_08940 [Holophagales bacterium]|nr:hypothetical protein [Holophagales bacterium]
MKDEYNYYYDYSKSTKSSYYANHCVNCGVIQGAGFLYRSVNSPFHVNEEKDAKSLKLYLVPHKEDLKVRYRTVLNSNADLIDRYAEKLNNWAVPYFSVLM